jgi:hypothetical protein
MRFKAVCSSSLAVAFFAAASPAEEPRDPAAFGLEELMESMAATSGVIAKFREKKQLALLERPIESNGTLYFIPPNRLVRLTVEPEPSALIIDGEKLRFKQGDREKFDLSGNPMARIFIDNFIVLFNGDLQSLQDLYRTRFSTDGEAWRLILEPRKPPIRGLVREISMRGDRTGIREMVMQNRDGDRTTTALDVIEGDYHFTDDQLESLFTEGTAPVTASDR